MCHYFLKLLINISKPAVYANYMQNHHFMTMSNEFRKIIIQSCKAVSDFIAEAALIRLLPAYFHPPLMSIGSGTLSYFFLAMIIVTPARMARMPMAS